MKWISRLWLLLALFNLWILGDIASFEIGYSYHKSVACTTWTSEDYVEYNELEGVTPIEEYRHKMGCYIGSVLS